MGERGRERRTEAEGDISPGSTRRRVPDSVGRLVGWLHQPEYTGENRCLPCTLVNLVLALLFAGGALLAFRQLGLDAAVAFALDAAVVLALGVFALSVLAIAVRGYLVPYTPTLTKRYLPDRVLAAFETGPTDEEPAYESLERLRYRREHKVDPDEFLVDAGVLQRTDESVAPTSGFADRLDEHLADVSPDGADGDGRGIRSFDRRTFGLLFDTEADDVEYEDREYPAITVGHRVRKWPGVGALVHDVAAERTLREFSDEWEGVPLKQRQDIREGLRAFREDCPRCGGPVEMTEDRLESCCRSREVMAIRCGDCGEQLLERDPAADSWTPFAGA